MSSSGPSDELVSQFLAVTGSADTNSATSYLEMSGNDVDTAVALFMEHSASGVGAGSGGGMGGFSAVGGFDGNSSGSGMAAAAAAAGGGFGYEGDIRAPDATRRMRLMDDDMTSDPRIQMMNAMMEEQLAQSAFASGSHHRRDVRAAINAAAAADDEDEDADDEVKVMEDGDDDGDAEDAAKASGPKRLQDIFEAPKHLIHKAGGFQGARTMAKDSKRWLLVNIQQDSMFASHALNRDVWRDELVENLIREGFIFWQQMDITPEGRTYSERYNVVDYPHVAIIDPRTGRLLWRKEGWTQEDPLTATSFAEMAMDFCSRNSFDRPPQAPRPAGLGASTSSGSAASQRPGKRPMHEMSEDEQLKAAMQASMQEKNGMNGTKADDGDIEYIDVDDDGGEVQDMDTKPQATASEEKAPSMMDEILGMAVPEEPSAGARVQFRMPDRKSIVRKFAGSDSIKAVYAFVAQSNEEARGGREFTLMAGFPPKDLLGYIEKTVDESKLNGESVNVRWKN